MNFAKIHIISRFMALVLITLVLFSACEKDIPLSAFDFEYVPEYKIEADIFPQNLGKSVLRIDNTFTIEDSMSIERAHIKDAEAYLLDTDGSVLSPFHWDDSAATYQYFSGNEPPPLDSIAEALDTLTYGAYLLDRVDFTLSTGKEYKMRIKIEDETFTSSFQPYPAVDFLPFNIDSIVTKPYQRGPGSYQCIYATMSSDTARLRWAEDPNAHLYTVVIQQQEGFFDIGPQAFAFPGPVLNFGLLPGTYSVVIGAMDERFYDHYYLDSFAPNHPNRNFFGKNALGYAGSVNERYLQLHIVP